MAFKDTVKEWFKTGLKPTQAQFYSKFDFLRWKDEKIPITDIEQIEDILNAKADAAIVTNHLTSPTAHETEFNAKEDKTQKGVPGGYAPLDEFNRIAAGFLKIVDDLVTGGSDALLSAEQGKILKTQIDGINALLTSNDVNLDTVQEIVDAIKAVETSLSTILVNDLTTGGVTKALTAEMGKSLKALIDALTTTVNGKMSTMLTTVKTITSAALTTQDTSGFVAYINALGVVLNVASNETVEYQLSDTGRVFKILLRGRSFGTGQPAITTADVEDITLWMQKDLKLSNYPNTRNDGQLSTNKVLSTDANGNVKLYSMPIMPAPFLEELIPDSYLPSTTGNFILRGSFFTPTMTVAIAGQTINYTTFISDNEVHVNVTTGAAEGSFSVTLNNGISVTFPNALLLVLGTVYAPLAGEWTTTGAINVSSGDSVKIETYNSGATAIWSHEVDYTKNWRINFRAVKSPLGVPSGPGTSPGYYGDLWLVKASDNSNIAQIVPYLENYRTRGGISITTPTDGFINYVDVYDNGTYDATANARETKVYSLRWVSGVLYLYRDTTLIRTLTQTITENMKIKIVVVRSDIYDIKYIETT